MIGGVGRSWRRGRAPPVLPSSAAARRAEHSVSCWYCDCKIYSFNDIIFNLGWRYARYMRAWFSAGVYFSVVALVGISVMLLWDSIGAVYFSGRSFSTWLQNLLASSFGISIMDIAAIIASTVFSIAFHEFGHAVAAASEGIQIEYVAVFVAALFPGALIALNCDQLQNLPLFSMLRIYCAGIWHNVMLCGVCVIMALLLPVVLYPLFVTGGLMITGVPEASPLSGYLSAHNFILSVDGLNITRADEWMKMLTQDNVVQISSRDLLEGSEGYRATGSRKGYCVPNSWMDASKNLWQINDKLSCPDDLVAFQRMSEKGIGKKEVEDKYCLIAKDVVKLKKCGNGWRGVEDGRSNFTCLEDEYCLVPVLGPGISWIEISYARPYSLECLQKERNSSLLHDGNNNPGLGPCQGTFVYAGDLLSAAHSIKLSSYRPRWPLLLFIADVPRILQDGLSCLFRVSAALAVVNCLPVYFLDGEAILETMLSYFSWFTRRQQRNILKVCRFLWTILSIVLFSRTLYSMTLYYGFV
uniref:Endopeptidase S2P n=1 Tax=Oryza glumipatula TaxID=40148 RepID=A0A0D9YCJ6_9ORYZ